VIAHWDDCRQARITAGHIDATWRNLGRAARSEEIGVCRIDIHPGAFSTPVHIHGFEEEVFYVVRGSGLLWQDGQTCRVGEGDVIVHRPAREGHTLCAGDPGLDVLAFGERHDGRLCHLPRAGVSWATPSWVDAGGPEPFEREAAVGPPECPEPGARPGNVVALADAPVGFGGMARTAGAAAGAQSTGLNHVSLPPGETGAPPHCHAVEEELFVVLAGTATLRLHPRGGMGDVEEHALTAGSVVARPAGTGRAHSFVAGPAGCTYLAYGTRRPDDMVLYPETGRVSIRGLGVAFTLPGPVA
jgi:uncharacterized cupin superfamily protein